MQTDFEKLKKEYLSGENVTLRSLSEKYGVAYSNLAKQSAQCGWAKQKKQNALNRASKSESTEEKTVTLSQTDKINRIAEKLLINIEQGTEISEKPTHIATLIGALKDVTAILRDVNEIPNIKDRQNYELSKRKLDIESEKHSKSQSETESGVVVLPEVKF